MKTTRVDARKGTKYETRTQREWHRLFAEYEEQGLSSQISFRSYLKGIQKRYFNPANMNVFNLLEDVLRHNEEMFENVFDDYIF